MKENVASRGFPREVRRATLCARSSTHTSETSRTPPAAGGNATRMRTRPHGKSSSCTPPPTRLVPPRTHTVSVRLRASTRGPDSVHPGTRVSGPPGRQAEAAVFVGLCHDADLGDDLARGLRVDREMVRIEFAAVVDTAADHSHLVRRETERFLIAAGRGQHDDSRCQRHARQPCPPGGAAGLPEYESPAHEPPSRRESDLTVWLPLQYTPSAACASRTGVTSCRYLAASTQEYSFASSLRPAARRSATKRSSGTPVLRG